MEDFPSNSHKLVAGSPLAKKETPEKEKVEKVIVTEVIQRKTPLGRRIKGIFFGGEVKGATKYIFSDVLLPALRNMVVDATSKGVERVVYGDAPRRRYIDVGRPRVSYNQPVDRFARSRPAMLPDQPPLRQTNTRRDAGEIILITREEAELVLERLNDIIDKYDVASVADLHDLVGLPTVYTDNKWGWTSLTGSDVRQVREGYLLVLPIAEAI